MAAAERITTLANQVLDAVNNVQDAQTDRAEDVVQRTRSMFRRRDVRDASNGPRGRKPRLLWRPSGLYLLRRSNQDFFPSKQEQLHLQSQGFGFPTAQPNLEIPRSWTLDQLDTYIKDLFPDHPLHLTGFIYGQVLKNKQLLPITECRNVQDLELIIKKGRLVILPRRDLPLLTENRERTVDVVEAPLTEAQDLVQVHAEPLRTSSRVTQARRRRISSAVQNPLTGARNRVQVDADSSLLTQERRETAMDAAHTPLTEAQSRLPVNAEGFINSSNVTQERGGTELNAGQSPLTEAQDRVPVNAQTSRNSFYETQDPEPAPAPVRTGGTGDHGTPVYATPPYVPQEEVILYERTGDPEVMIRAQPGQRDEVKQAFRRLSNAVGSAKELTVSRPTMAEDMLAAYQNPSILQHDLTVKFKDEPGEDLGGVKADLFTATWQKFYELYFKGEGVLVPFLPLHLRRKKRKIFSSIGRMLTHTAAILQYIPARISRVTLIQIIFGEMEVDEELLLEDFRLFLLPSEAGLISKAEHDFKRLTPAEHRQLENLFSMLGYEELPQESRLHEQLLAMADNELVRKPYPFAVEMRRVIPDAHMQSFWSNLTIQSLTTLYLLQRPTSDKVVEKLEVTDETSMLPPPKR